MSSPTPKSKNPTMAKSVPEAQETRTCANCHKPANQACIGCKDAPVLESTDTIQKIYYCSTNCQKSHWFTHKPHCKTFQTRKYLCRAGSLLQDIFLMYREKMFDKLISRIEERDGKVFVHKGEYGDAIDQILFPFPTELVGEKKENWMNWMAILSHQACSDIA